MGNPLAGGDRSRSPPVGRETHSAQPEPPPVLAVYAGLLEARGTTRVVALTKEEYRRAVAQLGGGLRLKGTPQESAQRLLQAMPEEELLAEVYRDRVLTLVPLNDKGPLVPEAEAALKERYVRWCERRGGGDCLGLFDDGPYLRTDDRRTLALALAFGTVLDETREALGRELSPRAVLSSLVWAAGLYLALWLVPEPGTKAVAAALSVVLLAWLGVDAMWGLMDGWARMAHRAHEATTFEELREVGEEFGRLIGTDAARALILAVATLSGRTLGEAATHLRSLPRFNQVQAQWAAQGLEGSVAMALDEVAAVEMAAEGGRAPAVVTSPQAPIALAMLGRSNAARTVAAPAGHSGTIIDIQHRGGNRQVVLGNGQRWHLPRGKALGDIPAEDKLGDELQAAAERIARGWSDAELTRNERAAIERARDAGNESSARHLEGLARGRWVNTRLQDEFPQLNWHSKGVDVVDPRPGGQKYEILSGTRENFAVHGRRMATEFFRMIFF
ncbi:SitA5 family polymorphic toxin [Archangium lipolyticum]